MGQPNAELREVSGGQAAERDSYRLVRAGGMPFLLDEKGALRGVHNCSDSYFAAYHFGQSQSALLAKQVIAIDYCGTSAFASLVIGTGSFVGSSNIGGGIALQSGGNGTCRIVPINQPNITGSGKGAPWFYLARFQMNAGYVATETVFPIEALLYNSFPGNVAQAGFQFGFLGSVSTTNLVFRIGASGFATVETIVTDVTYASVAGRWFDFGIYSDGARTFPVIGQSFSGPLRQPNIVSSTNVTTVVGGPVVLLPDFQGTWNNAAWAGTFPSSVVASTAVSVAGTADSIFGFTGVSR